MATSLVVVDTTPDEEQLMAEQFNFTDARGNIWVFVPRTVNGKQHWEGKLGRDAYGAPAGQTVIVAESVATLQKEAEAYGDDYVNVTVTASPPSGAVWLLVLLGALYFADKPHRGRR